MAILKVRLWRTSEAVGDPEIEVNVPASLAKWIPRMMSFVPKKTKVETWGEDTDFDAIFGNLEQMVKEAAQSGLKEILDVKAKDSHIKVFVES